MGAHSKPEACVTGHVRQAKEALSLICYPARWGVATEIQRGLSPVDFLMGAKVATARLTRAVLLGGFSHLIGTLQVCQQLAQLRLKALGVPWGRALWNLPGDLPLWASEKPKGKPILVVPYLETSLAALREAYVSVHMCM